MKSVVYDKMNKSATRWRRRSQNARRQVVGMGDRAKQTRLRHTIIISEFTDDQHVKSEKENGQNKSKQKGGDNGIGNE